VIQLDILNGTKAGSQWVTRHFPFQLGRSPPAALVLQDQGVWEQHATFSLRPGEGVVVSAANDAFVAVNGQRVAAAVLRNGDLIELGSVKTRFGLSPARQHSLRLRETLTWSGLALLCLGQIALIYWLTT
jgi:pSer/pThr/pTyr-binding forkhead associated (FHA) protein